MLLTDLTHEDTAAVSIRDRQAEHLLGNGDAKGIVEDQAVAVVGT